MLQRAVYVFVFENFFITLPLPSFSSCLSSTLLGLKYRWDIATSTNGAGTVFCCSTRPSVTTMPSFRLHASHLSLVLRCSAVSSPSYMYFYHLFLVSSTCHFYRAVCVCIHPCVFPILSRAVVLLYMGLTLATTACVSRHLYDFAMLSYDDVPSHVSVCALFCILHCNA